MAILSCGDDDQIIINRLNRRTLPGGERSSRYNGRTGRETGRTRRETRMRRETTHSGISICPLTIAPRRLSSRREGLLRPPPGGSSRMIHGDTNCRAVANGGRLSREGEFGVGGFVELATRPVAVVVSSVGGGGIRQPIGHPGGLPQLFLVEMIPSGELRHSL
jgi:hypothetical protein